MHSGSSNNRLTVTLVSARCDIRAGGQHGRTTALHVILSSDKTVACPHLNGPWEKAKLKHWASYGLACNKHLWILGKACARPERLGKERTTKQKTDSLLPKKLKGEEQEYHKYSKSPLPGSLASWAADNTTFLQIDTNGQHDESSR